MRASHRALEPVDPRPIHAKHVSIEFGNRVHALLTGHDFEPAKRIIFDEFTPTQRKMDYQVADATMEATISLTELGGNVIRREAPLSARVSALGVQVLVTCTIDLVVEWAGTDTVDLFDLKTGRMDQRSSFAQMAICAFLAAEAGWHVRDVVLLHVPRAKTLPASHDQASHLYRRPAAPLVEEARSIIRLVALAAQGPIAVPGVHCGRCEVTSCIYNPENDDETP